jgi:hypothetical protein
MPVKTLTRLEPNCWVTTEKIMRGLDLQLHAFTTRVPSLLPAHEHLALDLSRLRSFSPQVARAFATWYVIDRRKAVKSR